jgi:glycine dehydrogenase
MSFPVAGTLMIEPTESESKQEIDRFCDAMIKIREEIELVRSGEVSVNDSVLRMAPHVADDLVEEWSRVYPRDQAVFPMTDMRREGKYWPPVSRVDNVYGDRHLVCACPPMSAYA